VNGQVDCITTKFWAFGRAEQLPAFFAAVARNLAELPVDRLEAELRVLEIEGRRNRSATHVSVDLSERFGPHGPGLLNWPELGLGSFDADELRAWTRTHFTAENAVLWQSGPVPTGLELGALPRGPAPEPRQLPADQVPGRTFVPTETSRVSLSVLEPHRSGVSTTLQIAERRATERLRREGLSYAIEHVQVDLGPGQRLGLLQADGADEHPTEVADVLLEIARDLEEHGPEAHELARLREFAAQLEEHPQRRLGYLDTVAEVRAVDGRQYLPDDLDALVHAQTVESLHETWRAAMDTAVVVGPSPVRDQLTPGWTVVHPWSSEQLGGQRYAAIPGREEGVLVVGDAGVTWALDAERYRTVWWSDLEACLTLDSGTRGLVGAAGAQIWISPWCWQGGEDLTQRIDAAVDPARRIRIGEGSLTVEHEGMEGPSDIRWLATITGARAGWKSDEQVAVVIDVDGLFLLHGAYAAGELDRHLQEVRQADRDTLLRIDRRNRWIPQHEILRVELKQRPWTRAGMMTWMLTVFLVDGERHRVYLTSDRHLALLREHLPKVLGIRFAG
jgi:hypothetical protein